MFDLLCDDELFERFLQNEEEAYTALYRRYGARLLGYIHSLIGDDPGAEDLLQESFIRLYRERDRVRSGTVDPVRNVGGWLFRVARNLSLNHIRSLSYLAPLPAEQSRVLSVDIEESHASLFGEAVHEEALMQAVSNAVAALPSTLREVFVLREMNGLSYGEVSSIMGISEEAARMRLSRARGAIRTALQPILAEL